MPKRKLRACVIALPLLSYGCQSLPPNPQMPTPISTPNCPSPPMPDAWWMEPEEPTLTEQLLNELSTLPNAATAPSSP
ncbi:hypothetical protein F7R01_22175 [Pseudomonas argentinensis]|nr:hypothetical protein F7R01_22175 [Pseudomonas argentinensis]